MNGIGTTSVIDQGSSHINGNRPRSSHYDTTPAHQNSSNHSPNQQQAMGNRQMREMSVESNGGGYRSGSSSNRALYASPPTSNTVTNGYESSPSSKYSTPPVQQQQTSYRYSDYKPIPPPKTSVYKPVPPPKPKSYPRNSGNHQPMMNGMVGPQGTLGG